MSQPMPLRRWNFSLFTGKFSAETIDIAAARDEDVSCSLSPIFVFFNIIKLHCRDMALSLLLKQKWPKPCSERATVRRQKVKLQQEHKALKSVRKGNHRLPLGSKIPQPTQENHHHTI
jgi:hypothetical protein